MNTSGSPTANPSASRTSTGVLRPGGPGLLAGHTVSRIGYGAMQLGPPHQDHNEAIALLRRAVELGVDHFDTAQFYGDGLVNGFLRAALRPEDGAVIVSKIGAESNPVVRCRSASPSGPKSSEPVWKRISKVWASTRSR